MNRRSFLKGSMATGVVSIAIGAGILVPTRVVASYAKNAFDSESLDGGIKALYGTSQRAKASGVKFKAPSIAENGLVVPVTIDATKMKGVKSISVFVEENPRPLACVYNFDNDVLGYLSTRIKMGKSSNVYGIIETDSGLKEVVKEVKVTIGGCGG